MQNLNYITRVTNGFSLESACWNKNGQIGVQIIKGKNPYMGGVQYLFDSSTLQYISSSNRGSFVANRFDINNLNDLNMNLYDICSSISNL